MKFTTLKENLKEGISFVERVIGKNLTLPILNNILIETEDSLVKLSATDLEMGIIYWLRAKVEEEGGLTVPAKTLSSFVNSLPQEKISVKKKDLSLDIECKNYKSVLKGFSKDEFPIIPQIKEGDSVEIDGPVFSDGLSQIVAIPVLSQTRPEISGVYMSFTNKSMKLVATDSFRLAEKNISIDYSLGKEYSFIVPQKAGYELLQILSDKPKTVKIFFSPDQIMFETQMEEMKHPQVRFITRLIEGEYPNYQEIIPQNFQTQIILPREEFFNQVKVASLFSGKTNEIKIKTDGRSDELEIFSQNPDLGENKSTISGKIKGDKQEISFNYKFLMDGLMNIKSSEVILELNGPEAGVLRPVGDSSYLYILMPLKDNY